MSTLESTTQDISQWAQAASNRFLPLPASVYTCPEWFEKEIETIFYKEWICVGHVSELAKANDYLTMDIYDKPLLVVRDGNKNVRAFSNVCQHRSAIIAKGKGNKKLFVCPYHAWSYENNGKLKVAPHMDKEAVKDICLPEYKVEIWQGLVFVSLDAEAPPLAPRLEQLGPRYAPYGIEDYKVFYREETELECNWKALVENFCENYHVFHIHSQTLEPMTPTLGTEVREGGPGFNHATSISPSEDRKDSTASSTDRLPVVLQDFLHISAYFPCLAASVSAKSCVWLIVLPTGPQTIKFVTLAAAYPEEGEDEIPEEYIKSFLEGLDPVMEEDKAALRLVQKGLAAGTGQAGPLHPFEQTNWEFGHYLARTVLGIDTMQRPDNNAPWPLPTTN